MAEVNICIQPSSTVPCSFFPPVSLTESSSVVFSADNLPALLELLFYAMNLLSHLATCWVVKMSLTQNAIFWAPSEMFVIESGCICTCMVACDWWPHWHHPATTLQIFHPPSEKEKERETTHWVGTGVPIRLLLAVPGGPLLCWWFF